MTGHMLHGVDRVVIAGLRFPKKTVLKTDGRAYLWENGAVTVYREGKPWRLYPAHRILSIVGTEQG